MNVRSAWSRRSICKSEPLDESIDRCVQKYIEGMIGCKLPWLNNATADDDIPKHCDTAQGPDRVESDLFKKWFFILIMLRT